MNPQSNINDTLNNKLLIKGGKRTMIPHKMHDEQPIHKKDIIILLKQFLEKIITIFHLKKIKKFFFVGIKLVFQPEGNENLFYNICYGNIQKLIKNILICLFFLFAHPKIIIGDPV